MERRPLLHRASVVLDKPLSWTSSATGQAHDGGKSVPLAKLVKLGLPGAPVLSQSHRLTPLRLTKTFNEETTVLLHGNHGQGIVGVEPSYRLVLVRPLDGIYRTQSESPWASSDDGHCCFLAYLSQPQKWCRYTVRQIATVRLSK